MTEMSILPTQFGNWSFLYCACVSPQGDQEFWGNPPKRATMDLRPRRTRVTAPDTSSTRNGVTRVDSVMTSTAQSPFRDSSRPMNSPAAVDPHSRPGKVDIRQQMRLATWNVLTLAHTGYPEALVNQLAEYRVHLAGLTETRLIGSGTQQIGDHTLIYSGGVTHNNGVALLLDKRLSGSLMSWRAVSDRLMCARLVHKHGHLSIIVAYAPTQPSADSTKDTFYQELDSLISAIPPHDVSVIMGDFNAESGSDRQGFEQVVGNYGHGSVNDNSIRLLSLCAAHQLSMLGSWFKRKDIYRHSWMCNDGHTRKELDHILTNDRSFFRSIRVFRGAEPPACSDHRLVVATAALQPYKSRRKPRPPQLDTALLMQDSNLAEQYNIAVENAFSALDELPDDPEEAWSVTRQTILATAAAQIPMKRTVRRPWLTAETLDIIDQKKEARLRDDHGEWKRLKGMYKARSKVDLENFYTKIADEAESGFQRNNLGPAYQAIKRLRGNAHSAANGPVARSDGSMCTTPEEVTARWREHYQNTLNHPAATPCADLDDFASSSAPDVTVPEDAPTISEVTRAIRRLKNGRAAGSDGITAELLKGAEKPVSEAMHKLFLTVWTTGRVPAEWKEGLIVSLYKGKGSHSICSNYRPISLLSVPGKVFAHVLLARIQPLLNQCRRPQQSGFTTGRSTIDAILALRLLAELHRAYNRPLHVAYIDIKSAFDSVDRIALWKALRGTGIPPFLLHLLQDLHTGTTARIRTQYGISEIFHTTSGVRQGCILAPALFCCAIDWLMKHCNSHFGIDVGSVHFTDIDYADDAVLFTADPNNWAHVLHNFEASSNTMGLHTNWLKTKIQNIGAGAAPSTIHMSNQAVETVSKFTYLGSDVDSDGYCEPEIHRRLGIASSIMGQLDNVWRQQRLSLSTKLRIYVSLVLSVVLYGSETWTMRKTDNDRVQSFHMQSQRRILGVKWYDKITNAAIKETTELTDLPSLIADRRHSLFGHICRLPRDTPVSQALHLSIDASTGTPPAADWKRPLGRPRRTWLQQVEEDLGLPISACQFATLDRSLWRSLRPSAGQAQQ